ncbi:unnamed protein product [Blepharisma stoltei]|uniref:PH domain-containing protein n=1 Tax=Blepharisma stoltei TaxID=1481888 RepID=A0AAU9KGK6_9CILI|nr:unnamed protein product [Blepharisma stoltei]
MAECFNIDPHYKGPKIMQSYLKKLKHEKKVVWFLSKFTKRWFVLDLIHGVFYYTQSHSNAIPEKSYKIAEIVGFEPNPKTKDKCDFNYPLEMVTTDRVFILYAENKKVHDDWCKVLRSLFVPVDPDLRRKCDYVKSRTWKKSLSYSGPVETSQVKPAVSLYSRAPSFSIEGAGVFESNGGIIKLENEQPDKIPETFEIEEVVTPINLTEENLNQTPKKIFFEEEPSFECFKIDRSSNQDLSVYTSLDRPIASYPGEINADTPRVFERSWISNTSSINNAISNNQEVQKTFYDEEKERIDPDFSQDMAILQDSSEDKRDKDSVLKSKEKENKNNEEDNKLLIAEFCEKDLGKSELSEKPIEEASKAIFKASAIEEPVLYPSSKANKFIFPEKSDAENEVSNTIAKEEKSQNSNDLVFNTIEKNEKRIDIAEQNKAICEKSVGIKENARLITENEPNSEKCSLEVVLFSERNQSLKENNSSYSEQVLEESKVNSNLYNVDQEPTNLLAISDSNIKSPGNEASVFSPCKMIDNLFCNTSKTENLDSMKESIESSPQIISPVIENNILQKNLLENELDLNKNSTLDGPLKYSFPIEPNLAESPKLSKQKSSPKPSNCSNTEKFIKSLAKSSKKRISPDKLINIPSNLEYQTINLLEITKQKLDTSKNAEKNTNYENAQVTAISAELSKMENNPLPTILKHSNDKHPSRNSLFKNKEAPDSPSEIYQQNYFTRLSKIKSLQRSSSNPRKSTGGMTTFSSQDLYKSSNETARTSLKDSLNCYLQRRSKTPLKEKRRNGISRYEKNEMEEPRFSITEFQFKGVLPGEYTDRTGNDDESPILSCMKNSSKRREKSKTLSVGNEIRAEIFSLQTRLTELNQDHNNTQNDRILKKSTTYKQPLRNPLYDPKYTDRKEQLMNEISQPVLRLSQTQSRLKVNRLLSLTKTARDEKPLLKQCVHNN